MCFLVDRDGWRQPFNLVDIWLLHLSQKLSCIRRERLNIPTLSLGKDGVECQRRLPRAGYAGEADKFIARQLKRDVLKIMLPSSFNDDFILHSYFFLSFNSLVRRPISSRRMAAVSKSSFLAASFISYSFSLITCSISWGSAVISSFKISAVDSSPPSITRISLISLWIDCGVMLCSSL